MLVPLTLMRRRVELNGEDSDAIRFNELLYMGEMLIKLTTAAVVACLEPDVNGHQYRFIHALVRADGVGEWAAKLEEALTGPASQLFPAALFLDRQTLNERVSEQAWQYTAVHSLQKILQILNPSTTAISSKVFLRSWYSMFVEIRNKTRGHGATTPATYAKITPMLESSVNLLTENSPFLNRPWAFLHRNISGKYKVIPLGGDQACFAQLKSSNSENYSNGIYIWADKPKFLELVSSDLNCTEFFLPNGNFNGKTFETISLITDTKSRSDASPYLPIAGERPPSETEGLSELEAVGEALTNVPAVPPNYVTRRRLETEVKSVITNDRHPVVTLVGGGGIGKTSLVLKVLHEVAQTNRFQVIVWFSARDVDLTVAGPKVVRPRVLTEREIAEQYLRLTRNGPISKEQLAEASAIMAKDLRHNDAGSTLFVFDNFETIRAPIDLFQWLDTHIRLPNKIVITSRFREFKADFPIEVHGMENQEAEELISSVSSRLNIAQLGKSNRSQIIEDTNGHPYVIKIILGEIANAGVFTKASNLLVRKDDLLDALFERTYSNLSPLAGQIFLTLSGWRSLVPQIAVEAVMLRHREEGVDPERAIDELFRMSMVERVLAADQTEFLSVPLAAALFGRKKFELSPQRDIIESDTRFLQDIGATSKTGLKEGLRPRIIALFRVLAQRIEDGRSTLTNLRPVLEFVARNYSPAWLLLADLEQEMNGLAAYETIASCLKRFLETKPLPEIAYPVWQRLIDLYKAKEDVRGACNALLRSAEATEPALGQISHLANWLNNSRELIGTTEVVDRETLFLPLARLLERHIPEATATDLSRLAWLHLHTGNDIRALAVAQIGLSKESFNPYCQRLVDRIEFAWRPSQ